MAAVPPIACSHLSSPPRHRRLLVGVLVLWAIALIMRLWHLDTLEPPVFDEVYFPAFAQNYLDGIVPFDVHPPLGKYEIALGILVFGPTAFGIRISTAVAGSLIPVAVAGLAYQLSRRSRLALIAGSLMLLEGVFLVESRFGLMNVWLVLFGLTAQIYAIAGLQARGWKRTGLLACSGALLGASASVKWSGLGFALSLGSTAAIAAGLLLLVRWLKGNSLAVERRLGVLNQLQSLQWWHYALCFGLAPISVYIIQWLPHIWLLADGLPDSPLTFVRQLQDIHLQMLGGHENALPSTARGDPVHPYCSSWWSWPLLARPIGYFFDDGGEQWMTIHAQGNPILWWASTAAIASLWIRSIRKPDGVSIVLVTSYAANWLPWALVERCIFLYHYMGSLVFSILALAFVLDSWLYHPQRIYRWLGWNLALAILGCAIFFAPIWLGLPLAPDALYQRMWFRGQWLLQFNWI